MFKVGIHDNVVVSKAVKNDRGTLVVGIGQVAEIDPIAALNASTDSTDFDAPEQDFMFFPIQKTGYDNKELDSDEINKRIAELKDPLHHMLQGYMTNSEIRWDIFAGTGVTAENIKTKIKEDAVLEKVYSNIVDQFIKQITPHLNSGKKFRFILVRTSVNKHFPTLRKRYLKSNPFMEPMSVPADQSKLKFSKYELDNGLDKSEAVDKPKAAAGATVSGLFSPQA